MIGPSSSHTAGAARISRMARKLVGGDFTEVSFGMHGSFAETGRGHGTDLALVAGVLGMREDDVRLRESFQIAKKRGLQYSFSKVELNDVHENAVCMQFSFPDGRKREIIGCSLGGGRIEIRRIDGFSLSCTLEEPTMIVMHEDRLGMISALASALAEHHINIGLYRSTRAAKGGMVCDIIEADQVIPSSVKERIINIAGVSNVCIINPNEEENENVSQH